LDAQAAPSPIRTNEILYFSSGVLIFHVVSHFFFEFASPLRDTHSRRMSHLFPRGSPAGEALARRTCGDLPRPNISEENRDKSDMNLQNGVAVVRETDALSTALDALRTSRVQALVVLGSRSGRRREEERVGSEKETQKGEREASGGSEREHVVGTLTVLDVMRLVFRSLCRFDVTPTWWSKALKSLRVLQLPDSRFGEHATVATVFAHTRVQERESAPLVGENDSLLDVAQRLVGGLHGDSHRAVVLGRSGEPLNVVTLSTLVRVAVDDISHSDEDASELSQTLREMGLGTNGLANAPYIQAKDPAYMAFFTMKDLRVSDVAVISDEGLLLGQISCSDIEVGAALVLIGPCFSHLFFLLLIFSSVGTICGSGRNGLVKRLQITSRSWQRYVGTTARRK
jgi:CBS domain-containing protein